MTEEAGNQWEKPKEVDDVELAFPASVIGTLMPYEEEIPDEFEKDKNPWNHYVSMLFFKGGNLPEPKPGVDKKKAARHLKACLSSFEPKHEHKIAACAWLASMWYIEPPKEEEKPKE